MEKIRRGQRPDPMPELKYLPMFYLFPKELLDASPFADFPRNPHTVRESKHWMTVYNSEKFVETLADGIAGMVWRHFGIKASMESFSGYHPFWVLARSGDWVEVAARYGFNTYSLATTPRGFQFPVLSFVESDAWFQVFVATLRSEIPLDAWRDAVAKYPAHEDYEPSRQSRGQEQFFRKWYHSRALTKVFYFGDERDWEIRSSPGMSPWEKIDFSLDLDRFLLSLSERDRDIFTMMMEGYSQKEIARQVGYATHSAVGKRIQKLKARYREMAVAADQPQKSVQAVKNNWDEMTNLLFPKNSTKRNDS